MTPKEKAEDLVNQYRMILMAEDADCVSLNCTERIGLGEGGDFNHKSLI
jgi:hypothetical protein